MRPDRKRQRPRLATARAYYRLAGKAFKAGEYRQADHYRRVADRFVDTDRREQERRASRRAPARRPIG